MSGLKSSCKHDLGKHVGTCCNPTLFTGVVPSPFVYLRVFVLQSLLVVPVHGLCLRYMYVPLCYLLTCLSTCLHVPLRRI